MTLIFYKKIKKKITKFRNLFFNFHTKKNIISKFPGMPEKLILIVGCYNSGTTLLNHLLGKHNEISSLTTEGVNLTNQFLVPENFGWHRLWYKCRSKLEIKKKFYNPSLEKVKMDWAKYHDNRKKFALEKSIIHSLNIDWFEKNFSKPYFIWIVRNGYVVSEGIRRRTKIKKRHKFDINQPYPIEWCAKQWVESNKVISQKLLKVQNSYFLRYEDLMKNPKFEINKILNWLPVEKKKISLPNTFKFHNIKLSLINRNKKSLNQLNVFEKKKIYKVASKMLKKFHY